MNNEVFVQNIKDHCKRLGIPPTNACKNAGVGASFISDINRGQTPSVSKVQMLANYLGVTTSELLGEDITGQCSGLAQPDLVFKFNQLTPEGQKEVLAFIEFKATQEKEVLTHADES